MHTDEDPAIDDGYKKLLTAVLLVAWKDAHGRNSAQRAMALDWLHSAGAVNVCDWLGLPVATLRQRLSVYHTMAHKKEGMTLQHPTPKKGGGHCYTTG